MEVDIDYAEEDNKLFRKYCKNYKYYPLILPEQDKIVVIGDIHGDYSLALKVLRLENLIDENENWIGGNTFVIQVGDQVDNCRPFEGKCEESDFESISPYSNQNANFREEDEAEDVKVLKLFTKLSGQACKCGGAVISLMGNHEIMNVDGNMNYVSYSDLLKFNKYKDKNNPDLIFNSGKEARIHAFKPGNEFSKLLACTRLPAIIIGSFIFVHAGIIKDFVDKLKIKKRNDLYKISYSLRRWLLGLINKDYVTNIVSGTNYSLFWDRILGSIPPNMNNNDPRCIKYLNEVLDLFNVDKMIIGHTPQFFSHHEGINKTCNDKLWRVDFGGSFSFNKFDHTFNRDGNIVDLRNAQVLVITNNNNIEIVYEKDGKIKRKKMN